MAAPDSVVYTVARVVMARMVSEMIACGLDRPEVYVARQGTAADDQCPCTGIIAAIPQQTSVADNTQRVAPTPGAAPWPQLRASIRFRYTRCWPAVPRAQGDTIVLPTADEVDTAERDQLRYLPPLTRALVLGAWASDLPDPFACSEWTLTPITPVAYGGCAGWQATLGFVHDPGA